MMVDGPTSTPSAPAAPGKRRARTRRDLLAAAHTVFATKGFGQTTIEQVCEHAGYTRGAFYSNFASLDELFLAMWEQQTAQLLDRIRQAAATTPPEPGPGEATLETAAAEMLALIPVDAQRHRIAAEFTAHALRNESLTRAMTAHEEAIRAAILPLIEQKMTRIGRRITDREALGRALMAINDGTLTQAVLEPDNDTIARLRQDMFSYTLDRYTEPTRP
ncbi:TetR/AcrR family transcriptional regulator [Nocardia transvalensis]|uniref:TetR/AcrR family transcriptional regulator n=1 Tax=Nocardia transvalensis TaxID=37333 RepID=UPI001893C299|nr:TetR/AcrR family transcriptional regulator [Nocardia transvalensis]MBF6331926.1 TetR/AcrR family transcriptional regulator [Nocardia transvalensis]